MERDVEQLALDFAHPKDCGDVQLGGHPRLGGMEVSGPLVRLRASQMTGVGRGRARPLVKWAGGKTQLLPVLWQNVPGSFRRYVEPFLGGGALFFRLSPERAVLNDANPELIHFYRVVRDEPTALLDAVSSMPVSKDEFYRVRALRPSELDAISRAARFIYLNKTCFNGLYRVNKKGLFNTPFGGRTNVTLLDERDLWLARRVLCRAEIRCSDYRALLSEEVRPGDFVYLDPPYIPVGRYSDFKRYTKAFFYDTDHEELAHVYRVLSGRGAYVLLSISYHPKAYELYDGYRILQVSARRPINCRGSRRGRVKELLVANYDMGV